MTRWMTMLAAVLMVTAAMFVGGCGPSGPVGSWTMDFDTTFDKAMEKVGKDKMPMPKEAMEAFKERARKDAEKRVMTFKADGTYVSLNGDKEEEKGTWKYENGTLTTTPEAGRKGMTAKVRFSGSRMFLSSPEIEKNPMGLEEIALKRK